VRSTNFHSRYREDEHTYAESVQTTAVLRWFAAFNRTDSQQNLPPTGAVVTGYAGTIVAGTPSILKIRTVSLLF
jgi:hypothetical protein